MALDIIDLNIYLTRGDTAEFDLGVKVKETGEPYDYSNDLTQFTVKADTDTDWVIFQKTFNGTSIKIEPEDTAGLNYQTYKYDVQRITPAGDVYTVIKPHDFNVMEEVNHEIKRA